MRRLLMFLTLIAIAAVSVLGQTAPQTAPQTPAVTKPPGATETTPTADQLIDRFIKAMGGKEAIEKLKSGSEAFYDLRHRTIYETLVEMYDRKDPIEVRTVQQHLRDRQQLDAIGGAPYLSSLPDSVPSAANMGFYLNIVNFK